MAQYKLKRAFPAIPGFVEGALVTESTRTDHHSVAYVSLKGEDYYPIPRAALESTEPPKVEGTCTTANNSFVKVGTLQWPSRVSTGTNEALIYVGGDAVGEPIWAFEFKNRPANDTTLDLTTALKAILPSIKTASIRTVTDEVLDVEGLEAPELLRCAGIAVVPFGAVYLDSSKPRNCAVDGGPAPEGVVPGALSAAVASPAEFQNKVFSKTQELFVEPFPPQETGDQIDLPPVENGTLYLSTTSAGTSVAIDGPFIVTVRPGALPFVDGPLFQGPFKFDSLDDAKAFARLANKSFNDL